MAIFDFSEYQGNIDFSKVKGNADLIILRVQAGSTHADADYTKYVEGAKANNIPFGTYAYARFLSVADAQQEAKDCYSRMDKATQFVVVDVESVSTTDATKLVPATQAFIDYLHAQGVKKVGLYSGENFYKTHGLSGVKADFLWIANYGVNDGKEHTKPSIACDLWQFSSSATESGVVGKVDIDTINGSKPLSYFTGSTPVVVPTGNGSGVLTIVTQGTKLYSSDNMNAPVVRLLNKGETYKYYEIVQGWYNCGGNQWVRNVDIEVNSFTPAPKPVAPTPAPAPKPVQPAPAPQPAPQPAPKPVVEPQPIAQPMPTGNVVPPEKSVLVPPIEQPVQPSANVSDAPIVQEAVAPAIPVPQPVVPPVDAQPVVDALAKQIEDAVLKDPQLQQSIIKKLFAFISSIFK